MFPRLRFAVFSVALSAVLLVCENTAVLAQAHAQGAGAGQAQGEDKVYRYRAANGREVFTNAGQISVRGERPQAVSLPALRNVDLGGASASQLKQLDRSVQQAHDELQTGQRCQAIRASLRVPVREFLWREHLRQLCVGTALLALSLVVLLAWSGRLKPLMPLAPLLSCAYLGYLTYAQIDRRLGTLRDGLHACSAELPPASDNDPESVKDRLASASAIQAMVDRAYDERAATVESIMRQR